MFLSRVVKLHFNIALFSDYLYKWSLFLCLAGGFREVNYLRPGYIKFLCGKKPQIIQTNKA